MGLPPKLNDSDLVLRSPRAVRVAFMHDTYPNESPPSSVKRRSILFNIILIPIMDPLSEYFVNCLRTREIFSFDGSNPLSSAKAHRAYH